MESLIKGTITTSNFFFLVNHFWQAFCVSDKSMTNTLTTHNLSCFLNISFYFV